MTRRGYVAGALGIFLATLVVGCVLAVGGLSLLAEPIGGADQAGEVPVVDHSPLTCAAHHDQGATPPLDEAPEAMLICADPEGLQPWTAPAELVRGNLSRITAVLAGLEPAPLDDYPCNMVGGPSYELVLRFSGGRVAQVSGDTGVCGVVTVGSVDYFGAPTLLDTALALAEQGRVGRTPPADVPLADLSCDRTFTEDGMATSYIGEPGDLVRMVSCWQPNAPELGAWTETELNQSDVRVLARDLDRRAEVGGDPNGLRCPGGLRRHYFQHLVGQTSWGDVLLIAGASSSWTPAAAARPSSGAPPPTHSASSTTSATDAVHVSESWPPNPPNRGNIADTCCRTPALASRA